MIGLTIHYGGLSPNVVTFLDFGVGAAFLDHVDTAAFALRMSGGLKFGLVGDTVSPRSLHLKLGLMAEALWDDANAEPIGLYLLLGSLL